MKLAEALIQRADLQRRQNELANRLIQNAQYQEGEQPAESPADLLTAYQHCANELHTLIVAINHCNNQITLENGESMVSALALRDRLKAEYSMLIKLAEAATPNQARYSRSEIKMLAAVDIKHIRRQADNVAQRYRELDTNIQKANWAHEIVLNYPKNIPDE